MKSDNTYRTVGYPEGWKMRVLVAGATGTIGPYVVRRLIRAGHWVAGLTRNGDKAAAIRSVGAQAILADALKPAEVRSAVALPLRHGNCEGRGYYARKSWSRTWVKKNF
jgi:NADPH:quinone reductase-like Zn-dependent oxidoreductase